MLQRAFVLPAFPHVAASKHSEHGNEKDKGVLVCMSHSYPALTNWSWFKETDGSRTVLALTSLSLK